MDTCMYGDILCNLNRERNPLTSMLVAGGMCADRNNVSYAQRLETSCVHACTHACLHASRCVGMAEQGGLYNMCACVMPPPTQNDRESWGCMALLSRWPPDAWEAPCPAGGKSNRKDVSSHATSAGVAVQNQQQPSFLLWAGKWKIH